MAHLPLPAPAGRAAGDDFDAVCRLIREESRKIVVLDDDPTGTQTIHGLEVLTEWSVPALERGLKDVRPGFFILTNSRALSEPAAVALNAGIADNLRKAAVTSGVDFSIISRSDSTLRGHFAAEINVLAERSIEPVDGIVVIPAFFEGGRYTIENVHYVAQGDVLIPAAETEFARDVTFGFRHSDLTRWIEEKTRGVVKAGQVRSISLETLRTAGAEGVRARLALVHGTGLIIVNAENYRDMEAFVHGLLLAERDGKRFLFRTAASFVRIRAGITEQPLLAAGEIRDGSGNGGLVVVGSYVKKTSEQLEQALSLPRVEPIELVVDRLIDRRQGDLEIARVAAAAGEAIGRGVTALVFTSRSEKSALGRAGSLEVAQVVSNALVGVLRSVRLRPSFVLAKGGITSSDLAVKGLGVRSALVLGQVAAGVPVWQIGEESLYPGLKYIIFPGNVGSRDSLRKLLTDL
ncbi:MAG: four-carbon acid sugar kinase family protein [Opitutaceae bacterium]